jgi:hypothetical protein
MAPLSPVPMPRWSLRRRPAVLRPTCAVGMWVRHVLLAQVVLPAVWPVVAAAQGAPPSSSTAPPPAAQHPSPMQERTRLHARLAPASLDGVTRRVVGPGGRPVDLWISRKAEAALRRHGHFDVVVHFHGAAWLPQQAVADLGVPAVAVVVNLGSGSGIYDRTYRDPAAFDSLLAVVTRAAGEGTTRPVRIRRLTLTAYSAGHGAVRAILRESRRAATVQAVLLLDGMHTSYVPEGRVLADGGTLDTTNLTALAAYARSAMRGEARFVVTHSEIFPGTFASTTETADWLLESLGVRRRPVLRWGPRGLQQLSEARAGGFRLRGYAGNSAPDHIDQFHAMPELLRELWR